MKNSLGIYIHIPFCVQKCHYCDFCSAPAGEDLKKQYVTALVKNIESTSNRFNDKTVDSIFFGGGTPTCLPPGSLIRILETVRKHFSVAADAETSLECNPATADKNDFKLLWKNGFNRLSMGLQSAHNEELRALGRIHTFEDFAKTFSDARSAGFENINLDLMYGIPLQTEESFRKTLETVISYSPEHVSAYALKIEPNTLFFKKKESLILPDEDSEYNMYKLADRVLGEKGYDHYEISNYAQNGYKSRHNLKYWNCDDYIGFGVSAHSCIEWDRYAIDPSIRKYINLMSGENPDDCFVLTESLSKEDFSEEYIMMRMRLGEGLSLTDYKEKFSNELSDKYLKRMLPFINSGHIISNNGHYSFSVDGMYISNYLLSEILDLE